MISGGWSILVDALCHDVERVSCALALPFLCACISLTSLSVSFVSTDFGAANIGMIPLRPKRFKIRTQSREHLRLICSSGMLFEMLS
jgi:hypothetical protein